MQVVTPARRQLERTEATRAALVAAARRLFIRKGYARTGTPEIVAAAKLTRGALYHHFEDKGDLFLAVARQAASEVAGEIERGSSGSRSPVEALLRGAESYFAAMAEQGRARLLLLDAPAVLKPAHMRELSELAGARELREGLAQALGDSQCRRVPLPELAALVSAAFDQAALAIVNGKPSDRYRSAMRFLLERLAAGPDPPA